MPAGILQDVAPLVPWSAAFAATSWAQAVAGGIALCPAILAREVRPMPALQLRLAHGIGLVAVAGALGGRMADIGLPGRIPMLLGNLNIGAPLAWGALAGVVLVAALTAGLALGARRGAGACAVLAALGGIAFTLNPAFVLTASPTRDIFRGGAAILSQLLTATFSACAFLAAAGPPVAETSASRVGLVRGARRVLLTGLLVAFGTAFYDRFPGHGVNTALAEKARLALLGPGLWLQYLVAGLAVGTAVPLLLATRERLVVLAAAMAVVGRLAVDAATIHVALTMLGA